MADPLPPLPGKRRPRWRKLLVRVALLVLFFWLATGALVVFLLPRRFGGPTPEPIPEALAGAEALRLSTSDGLTLGAWYTPGAKEVSILLLHGRSASRTRYRSVHAHLRDLGHPTLSLTFRGHGDSDGSHNDFGYSSRLDVIAGVQELKRRHPANKVVVLGASLGAAAALHAAAEVGTDVDAYFLESPYSDLYTAARNRCDAYLPPILSHASYASMRLWAPVLLRLTPAQSRPIDHVASIRVPVLIVASVEDRLARIDEARAIRDRNPVHCTLIEFPDGSHGRLVRRHRDAYLAALANLVRHIK